MILIVDDNPAVRAALELLFSVHALKTVTATTPAEALARVERGDIDLVIQDMNFTSASTTGTEGVALFGELRKRDPEMPIVVLTAWTNLEVAIGLVKAGAADYLPKPWNDEKLVITARNLLALRQAAKKGREMAVSRSRARRELAERYELCGLVYESDAMHEVASLACRVARADVPVLITGPSGAGKEKIAQIVQRNSPAREGPFVSVHLGALPADLVSAELFGAEAGAFTGATKARSGRFEAADGGTLFLDEIGTLSPEGQVKLLRVLQTGSFERLGSSQTRNVKVRVISATNANLQDAIAAGRFREDLYYRLNVVELEVPPLAARREDIAPIARAFLDGAHNLSPEAVDALATHAWPGNVRELENTIRRACVLAKDSTIRPADLGLAESPADGQKAAAEPDGPTIERLLTQHGGVIATVAKELGLSRQALYRRMEKLGIKTDG